MPSSNFGPAGRLSVIVGFAAVLTGCSFGYQPSAVIVGDNAQKVQDRFDNEGLQTDYQYTAAVPRAYIDADNLDPAAPDVYTVVRGDTLWDISDRFLKEPWRWTEIWSYNPQVYNPHLIYPGDELALEYVNGQPTLVLTRNGKTIPTQSAEPSLGAANPDGTTAGTAEAANGQRVRLSPRIRSESLDDSIPTISRDVIQQFLVHPRVVDLQTIHSAPYVVGNYDGRLTSSLGHQFYVRGDVNRDQTQYGIYRKSKELRDPVNDNLLGYEITHVADAKLLSTGDPSTLMITSNKMETIAGDILLESSASSEAHQFVPRLPELRGEGRIVSLVNAISQTGRDQVVVLNIGAQSSVEEGDVLAIESRGDTMIDPRGRGGYEEVSMPNIRTGVVMVFKTFDKVSYALVMESTRPVMMGDIITGI